ncbi:MAG: hypothetical protein AAF495_12250 [Pseudomonadota bacterium]
MKRRAARILLLVIAGFYAYGATVHVLKMASMTGFQWTQAPLKWQLLDIVYLALDLIAVVGLVLDRRFGWIAVLIAALSQLLLYTLLRDWVLDVPAAFRPTAEQVAYLDGLVAFHGITLAVLAVVWWLRRSA